MDKIQISIDNQRLRDLNEHLRPLRERWLSSDPIQIGGRDLPLRPVVGVLVAALSLLMLNGITGDAPDTGDRGQGGIEPHTKPAYPVAVGGDRAGPRGPNGFLVGPAGGDSLPRSRETIGRGPGHFPESPFLSKSFPGHGDYGDQFGYLYDGNGGYSTGMALGYRRAGPAPASYQGFRFREEEVTADQVPADWADYGGYRFRPLTGQEQGRMHSAATQRSLPPSPGAPSLYDELSGPYMGGLDWQAAPAGPDYSGTW